MPIQNTIKNKTIYIPKNLYSYMGFMEVFWWPFGAAFAGAIAIVGILFLIFWIWMIVDAAKRNFKNDVEKILWIVILVLTTWVGSLVYFIVIKTYNPRGLAKK